MDPSPRDHRWRRAGAASFRGMPSLPPLLSKIDALSHKGEAAHRHAWSYSGRSTVSSETHRAAQPIGWISALRAIAGTVRVPPDCRECSRHVRCCRRLMVCPMWVKAPTDTLGRTVGDPPCQMRPAGLRSPSDASQPSGPSLRPCGCRLIARNALAASAVVDDFDDFGSVSVRLSDTIMVKETSDATQAMADEVRLPRHSLGLATA